MAQILDGRVHADRILEQVAAAVKARVEQGIRPPCLAVVLVGEDSASQVYVKGKVADCARTGIRSIEHRPAADIPQADLNAIIDALNADPEVDGILVQLPLPKGLDAKEALHRIDPAKDVDGFHPVNQGLLLEGLPALRPCTPTACMNMLEAHGVELKGKRAVVLGRSEIVGKPMALMLLEKHATVTIAHSRTVDLPGVCREADILVAAVGRAGLVEGSWIKPGAIVIDVGINRVEDPAVAQRIFAKDPKKLETFQAKGAVTCGDVRYAEAMEVASAVTPVPGGVGLLTRAGLMLNTIQAWKVRTS
jgi:methylenetetrahydrofolate dehydrogenase (NADP+)/methenyltetrahydrofolate cyclohydrolase